MNINGEEIREKYLREAGRDLTDVDTDAEVEEAHIRVKKMRELWL